MNYKKVKKNKKNTGLIVVASILALILAGGAVAGIGYAFDWWKTSLPTSTYNMEIASLDELEGLKLTKDAAAWVLSTYDMTTAELIEEGLLQVGETKENMEYCFEQFVYILDVSKFGEEDMEIEDGVYDVTVKVNGTKYVFKEVVFDSTIEDGFIMAIQYAVVDGKIELVSGNDVSFETGDSRIGALMMMRDVLPLGGMQTGQYCYMLMGVFANEEEIESVEFVSFEKVDEIEAEEKCESHVDVNNDSACDVCGEVCDVHDCADSDADGVCDICEIRMP